MAMMSDLPEMMLIEILIRLPVISLLAGKCVCKTWLSIISNPKFIKSQLHRTIKNPPTLLTLLKPCQQPQQPQQEDLVKSSSPIHFKTIVIPPIFDNALLFIDSPSLMYRCHDIFCLSSYNGIICLHSMSGEFVHLWNPSTRQGKILPHPPRRSFTPKLGFAYDTISDDYMVVWFMEMFLGDHVCIVQLYSTNADTWTEFETRILKKVDVYDRLNAVVNGVLYLGNGDELISFNLHDQVVGLVSLPSLYNRDKGRSNIMDFQGSVAMLFESGPGIFELWMLEGVPDQMSWTRKFSICTDSEIWLHCYLGAGQFSGCNMSNRTHFLYDYESEEIRYYVPVEPNGCATLKYSETLVSLNGFELVESDDDQISGGSYLGSYLVCTGCYTNFCYVQNFSEQVSSSSNFCYVQNVSEQVSSSSECFLACPEHF